MELDKLETIIEKEKTNATVVQPEGVDKGSLTPSSNVSAPPCAPLKLASSAEDSPQDTTVDDSKELEDELFGASLELEHMRNQIMVSHGLYMANLATWIEKMTDIEGAKKNLAFITAIEESKKLIQRLVMANKKLKDENEAMKKIIAQGASGPSKTEEVEPKR